MYLTAEKSERQRDSPAMGNNILNHSYQVSSIYVINKDPLNKVEIKKIRRSENILSTFTVIITVEITWVIKKANFT